MQIGFFMVDVDPFHRRATFNVVIGEKSWWGKGVVNEARAALLDEFFNNREIEKAAGMPFARNFPAVFNYKAQGWRHEGTLSQLLSRSRTDRDLINTNLVSRKTNGAPCSAGALMNAQAKEAVG